MPTEWDKIVVVTRKTGLEELLERFVTKEQARFYLEHSGVPFEPYEEEHRATENQSSSGIIVSTGAGSTGWLSSVLNGAAGVVEPFAGKKAVAQVREGFRFAWDAPRLCFSVREPFISKASAAGIVWGDVRAGEKLEVVSQMPQDGVIFCDGVEADYLSFDSGAVTNISVAEEKARLVAA